MTIYISILRGINVSGHNLIKMDALRKMYESLGFKNVKTYLQSGNVVFLANETENNLKLLISKQIKEVFGFEIPVLVLSLEKLKNIINNNPLSKDPQKEAAFFHVTFLSNKIENIDIQIIKSKKMREEEIVISENVVYLYCPNGYGNTKLSNNFLENKLDVSATTRNWKTTNEIYKIAQQLM